MRDEERARDALGVKFPVGRQQSPQDRVEHLLVDGGGNGVVLRSGRGTRLDDDAKLVSSDGVHQAALKEFLRYHVGRRPDRRRIAACRVT